jgi:cbb3-type cytochrome oxidase subunit 3
MLTNILLGLILLGLVFIGVMVFIIGHRQDEDRKK